MENIIEKSIGDLVRKAENDYTNSETTSSKYVRGNMYEDLSTIDAYLNSKHISGDTDSAGRDKPFFNICTAAVNIWYRATDIDRKDIRFKASKSADYLLSFLATAKLQEFMRKEQIGKFLNDWGLTLARYGSAVLEFVENSQGLKISVIPWNKLIVDAVDFDSNPVIKVLEMTPAQLKKKKEYNQDLVENLLDALQTRETLDKQKKDLKSNYIKIYEVHGELEKSYLTGKESDEEEYIQQMHVVSFVESKEKGKFDDFTLFSSKSKKIHMITHLIKEEGQTLSIGAVKNLFQAQWMTNHSIKSIKDQLDLASKLIFQTSDTNYANKNILSDIENGFIAIHKENMPLTQIQNNSHDISSLQSFGAQWQNLGNEINSTPDSIKGINPPSNQPLGTTQILTVQGTSLFEQMVENKGLYIEEMMREFIIPYLKKQLDTKDEIVATLDDYGIQEIDQIYIPTQAAKRFNRKAVQAVIKYGEDSQRALLQGNQPPELQLPDYNQEVQGVTQELSSGMRFFKPSEADDATWKELLADFDWDSLEINVTNEQGDKQAILTTLQEVFKTVATNPMALNDPNTKMLFNEILETAGTLSPLQFKKPTAPVTPQQVGVGDNQTPQ